MVPKRNLVRLGKLVFVPFRNGSGTVVCCRIISITIYFCNIPLIWDGDDGPVVFTLVRSRQIFAVGVVSLSC
jgi:hypothetical protein